MPDAPGRLESVGVGIATAHAPLHRSGRADFAHPALTLGDDAKTAEDRNDRFAVVATSG